MKIQIEAMCPCCDHMDMVLHTDAEQDPEVMEGEGWAWMCHAEDRVVCSDCGAECYMDVEPSGEAFVSWNEDTEHNIACWDAVFGDLA